MGLKRCLVPGKDALLRPCRLLVSLTARSLPSALLVALLYPPNSPGEPIYQGRIQGLFKVTELEVGGAGFTPSPQLQARVFN